MYYAFLGHMPVLSLLELKSLGLSATSVTENMAVFPEDPKDTLNLLGGTIKIAEELVVVDRKEVLPALTQVMNEVVGKNQALTDYADLNLSRSELHQLKESITRSVRFVSMETTPHESVMLLKQNVAEYNLIKVGDRVAIARSIWFQDGIEWSKRDRNRPYQDIKRGMLPPKLSRVMVNLASGGKPGILLDPFCGTGTVLMEGALLGHQVIGSDNDGKAVEGAKVNLDWLVTKYELKSGSYSLHTQDATHISEQVKAVDYIVTEPYMGPLVDGREQVDITKLKNIAKGLDKLYRGALRDWNTILSPGGKVVMIFPEFHINRMVIPTISVDTLAALGYNTMSQVPYGKPDSIVVRNITVLKK